MRWVWKTDDRIETVADKQRPFSQLRRAVVDCIDLEAVHVIRIAIELLKIIGEQPYDGPGFFIGF